VLPTYATAGVVRLLHEKFFCDKIRLLRQFKLNRGRTFFIAQTNDCTYFFLADRRKFMFKVNDYVMYNSTGVYKIIDITREKDINNHEIEYYVLEPAYENNNLTIKIPVQNQKVFMRKILSKEAVLKLIAAIPTKETNWIEDNRARIENFKTALRTGESEELVKLIKTLYLKRQERTDLGKKLWKVDEDIMKVAEKNLNEEFAIVLNIEPDEVASYIQGHITETA